MLSIVALSLLIWAYLALFHSRFWHSDHFLNHKLVNLKKSPSVVCIIPARNEAETIGGTVRTLLDQDYAGTFSIIIVDDNSDDWTTDAALAQIKTKSDLARVTVVKGAPLEDGWVGKMWAVSQGADAAQDAEYILLTDADIEHAPGNLSQLVAKAVSDDLGLVSLMVRLRCHSDWEKILIPAFVYFFQKLYPFPEVNDPKAKLAAAAGGCMLVHAETLHAAGGLAAIRDRIIDDCALARLIKPHRPIWLGLTEDTHSLRAYDELAPIWRMVTRSAYVQLDHNLLVLLGTLIGMFLLYAVPVVAVIWGVTVSDWMIASLGMLIWLIMAWTYLPTLDIYHRSAVWALALPFAGMLYTIMTLDSARLHYTGQGAAWKGRTYG